MSLFGAIYKGCVTSFSKHNDEAEVDMIFGK
jgi:hypothetical protein